MLAENYCKVAFHDPWFSHFESSVIFANYNYTTMMLTEIDVSLHLSQIWHSETSSNFIHFLKPKKG